MKSLQTNLFVFRVKLPKTFLAINLSDAFSFQEKQNAEVNAELDGLEMKAVAHPKPAAAVEPRDFVEAQRVAKGEEKEEEAPVAGPDSQHVANSEEHGTTEGEAGSGPPETSGLKPDGNGADETVHEPEQAAAS